MRRSEALIGSETLASIDHMGVELVTITPGQLGVLDDDDDVEFASPVYRLREDAPQVVFHTRRVAARFDPDPGLSEVERRARRLRASVLSAGDLGPGSYLLEAVKTEGPYGTLSLALRMVDEEGAAWASPDIVHEVIPRTTVAERETRAGMTTRALDQWHLNVAKVRDAWNNHGIKGEGITVAVIDDGVDVDHTEFDSAGKLAGEWDFEQNVADGRPKTAEDTHGTSCAGVAVARGVQASGAAPAAGLLAVRLDFAMSSIDEARMFRWAGDRAHVISCSWGPDQPYFPPDVIVEALREVSITKGVPIFFAAGNEAEDMSTDGYAASPYTIAVAASTDGDTVAPYSDFGADVDLCAPSSGGSKDITTTDRSGAEGKDPGDYRTDFGGTSSATPLVAGVAALILAANRNLSTAEVRDVLCSTADKIGDPSFYDASGHSVDFGFGRVNADAAVAEARRRSGGGGGGGGGNGGGTMSIRPVSAQVSASGPPPTFQLDLAGNGVYSVEVATDPALFDEETNRARRNADSFFSSYEAGGLLTALPYQMPEAAWRRLNKGSRLYYRAMSARAADDLSDFQITTPDDSAASAPFITVTGATGTGGGSGTREVAYPSGARFDVIDEDTAGEDYADPTGGGVVPLIDTTGRLAERLAPNFTLGEFVGKVAEQYRYARVSVELVSVLQQMRTQAGAGITLASSYRPPAYNASVEGANRSQHLAGQAADLKISGRTPLEAAELALEVAGGDIGLGLGPTTVHLDLRGEPASWVYEGAVMNETEFDQWVAERRGRREARRRRREATDRRAPSVLAPTRAAADAPPAFVVRPGSNRWVAVDVVTDPALFAPTGATGTERTDDNSYGTWEGGLVEATGSEVVLQLPEHRWDRLALAGQVFYRALATSADSDDWPDLAFSLADDERNDAPMIEVGPEQGPRRQRLVLPIG